MKKFFSLMMALVLMFCATSVLSGCNGNEQESEEIRKIPIVENGNSNYIIIYPDVPTSVELEAVSMIKSKIQEKTGVRMKSLNEEFSDEETDLHKIYIGNTSFESAKATKEQIAKEYFDAYAIDIVDLDAYIVGASETALFKAAEYFVDTLIERNYDDQTKTLYFEACRFVGSEPIPTDFATKNIKEYSIIYSDKSGIDMKSIALKLQAAIKQRTEFAPSIYIDTDVAEKPFEILVGETNRALSQRCYKNSSRIMEYEFIVEQCKLQLAFGGYYSAEKCIDAFSFYVVRNVNAKLASGNHNSTDLAEKEQELTAGADVRIMSANILAYRWGEKQNEKILPVSYRGEIFAGVLLKYRPDAVGIQETDEPWLDILPWYLERLKKDGIEYTHLFGKITHGGKTMTNFSSIVYRSDMYAIDDSGYEAFSIWEVTPNYFQRVASYVKLTSKTDPQKQFVLVNTHWAHEKAEYVNACAVEQAALVNKLKDKYSGVTIFCTGDYNNLSTRAWGDKYLNQLVSDIGGKIASKVAKQNGVLIVPGGCRGDADDEMTLHPIDNNFIDHVICAGGSYEIKRHDTIRENKCNILTDHSPIYADIKIK